MLFPIGMKVRINVPEDIKGYWRLKDGIGTVRGRSEYKKAWPFGGNYVHVKFDFLPNDSGGWAQLKFPSYPVKRDWLSPIEDFECKCDFSLGQWSCKCGLGKLENEKQKRN